MNDRPKLTIKKPLRLERQSQLFQALKPLLEQAKNEKLMRKAKEVEKKKEKQKRIQEIKKTLNWLYEAFPETFTPKDPKPLKLSIHHDIYPLLDKEGSPTKAQLKDALTYYTRNIHYLESVIQGTHRYDLNGNEVEEITTEHKEQAEQRLKHTLNILKEKKTFKKDSKQEKNLEK